MQFPFAGRLLNVTIDPDTTLAKSWQQIQAGKRRYDFTPACLSEIAGTAIDQMRPQADAKSITLKTEFDHAKALVNTDEAALTDAVENLIDNAIKYSPSATQILVSCAANDHQAWIEVRDEGLGIAHDELPHIFDRFYRGRRGDISNVHGTGLGLALVKATVEAHGGAVEVTSKPGAGSCFRLRLPIVSEPRAVATGSSRAECFDPIATAPGSDTRL